MAEQLNEKRKTRRNKRSALTRAINIVKTATSGDNESQVVEGTLERLRQAFKAIEETHEALVELIEEDGEFAEAESYMETCEKDYTEGLQIGLKYLAVKEPVAEKNGDNAETEQANQETHDIAKYMLKRDLLTKGLSQFGDDPMDYRQWKQTFKGVTEELDLSSREESDLVIKWLGPKSAKSMMRLRAVHPNDQDAGLKAIWRRLDEEYGAPELIEGILISKLESFPRIGRDQSIKLREFADFLSELQAAKSDETLPGLVLFDTYRGVSMAVDKLPFTLQESWRKEGSRYKENKKVSFPPFHVFVDFVRQQAKIRNDPSFRLLPSPNRNTTQGGTRGTQARSFSTTSFDKQMRVTKCVCCDESHAVIDCTKFKEMSLSDRDMVIRTKGLCRGCLKRGHIWAKCSRRQVCNVCRGPHPTILHKFQNRETYVNAGAGPTVLMPGEHLDRATSHCSSMRGGDDGDCVSSVLPVLVSSAHSEATLTYAILDEQSDACFMTEALKTKLEAKGTKISLEIATILNRGTVRSEKIRGLTVKGLNEENTITLPAVYTRQDIPVSVAQIPTPEKMNAWPHLQNVRHQLSPLLNVEVGLLIGANCPKALMPVEVIPGSGESDPYAVRTALGWGVVGVTKKSQRDHDRKHFAFRSTTKEVIRVLEQDFLDLNKGDVPMTADEWKFLQKMDEGLQMVNGHVQLPLPFKKDRVDLPDNKDVAWKRLNQLKQKMNKKPVFAVKYIEFMNDIFVNGQAEQVPPEDRSKSAWYIPHHGVFHPRKPDKLRVVMDCAAGHRGTSLNDHLLQGPNLTNSLIGVLMRFRQEPIAVVGDIKGMFYQVLVDPKDRDYLRFLWWTDGKLENVSEFRMCVHVFGATSSPGCANYALKKVADLLQDLYGKDAAEFVRKGFYVDDGLKSVPSVEDAVSLLERTIAMLQEGGFKLHKFRSNSAQVLRALPAESIAPSADKLDLSNLPTERTLGLLWNAGQDTFTFDATPKNKPVTRRGILSTVSAIFDPLGLVGPYVLTGKRILQSVCANGMDWDDPVGDETLQKWNLWKEQLIYMNNISIERCYKMTTESSEVVSVELHHFSDASEMGYGQCSYLRIVDDQGRVKVSLAFSKCRVAPLKITTIPRLELVAATVSVKASALLREELEFDNIQEHFWTDSRVVLGYIGNEARRFHTFVANRVQQIRDGSNTDQWHYISTKENPADIASRGASVDELKDCRLWWHGPKFLSEEDYSIEASWVAEVGGDDVEVKKTRVLATQVKSQFMTNILKRFSTWTKAKRVIARCHIFIQKAKKLKRGNDITIEDLTKAENVILKMSQQNTWDDLKTLEKLDPFMDHEGLLRVGGRLKKSNLPEEIKHPVILPAKDDLTTLIVRHFHGLAHHQGRGITLNTIRSAGFWIVGGSKAVARCIHDCVTCRRLRRPTETQRMADLPPDRLQPAPPFTYCGVDLFGPIIVKSGRKQEKRYGVLFTCLVSRGVHIEVANALTTDSFMNAFRRFQARRGPIKQMRSDQGRNFIGATQELKAAMKEMDQEDINLRMMSYNCEWIFNPPHASHFGGSWERMIRTTRNILDSLMLQHKAQLDDEMLVTFLSEAEATINSRPLCTTTDAGIDPLTPAHLLTMKASILPPPPGNFQRDGKFCRKLWRRVQHLCEIFWCRWRKEYVSSLQRRQKWNKTMRNIAVGDVVLLVDGTLPRNHWELCRVTNVKQSEDGLVRSVTLFTGRRRVALERPVSKIILLLPED